MKSFDRNDPKLWALPEMDGIEFIAWDASLNVESQYYGKHWYGYNKKPVIGAHTDFYRCPDNIDSYLICLTKIGISIDFTENWQDSLTQRPR
jgi:hypothetical protein